MKKHLVLNVFLVLLALGCGKIEKCGVLPKDPYTIATQEYQLSSDYEKVLQEVVTQLDVPSSSAGSWRDILSAIGVKWPKGSAVTFDQEKRILKVTNRVHDLRLVELVAASLTRKSKRVAVEVQGYEFDKRDIESILRKQPIIDIAALSQLRDQGKGRMIFNPRVVVNSGEEGVFKDVVECVYPTEYYFDESLQTNRSMNGNRPLFEPEDYESIDTGIYFSVLSECLLVEDGKQLLFLAVCLDSKDNPDWQSYSSTFTDAKGKEHHLDIKQPLFFTQALTSMIIAEHGRTVLLGGGIESKDQSKMLYLYLRVDLLGDDDLPLERVLSEVSIMSVEEYKDEMETWMFRHDLHDLQGVLNKSATFLNSSSAELSFEEKWKKHLELFGVTWPEGSSISYQRAIKQLIITNTPKNLDLAQSLLRQYICMPPSMRVGMLHVEFDREDIAGILRKNATVDTESLQSLWKAGKGRLLSAPQVVCDDGGEPAIRSVTEYIYPTEYFVESNINAADDRVAVSDVMVEPFGFHVREIGTTFRVRPELSPDAELLSLSMTSELSLSPFWNDFGSEYRDAAGRRLQAGTKFPNFSSYSTSGSLEIQPDSVVMVSGGVSQKNSDKVVYSFVNVSLINERGEQLPFRERKGSDKYHNEAGFSSTMISVSVDFLRFRNEDIEDLKENKKLSPQKLYSLLREGNGDICHMPSLVSCGGESEVKSVVEYMYPEEYFIGFPGSSTNVLYSPDMDLSARVVVEPQELKRRDMGVTLKAKATPQQESRLIDLSITFKGMPVVTWKNQGKNVTNEHGVSSIIRMETPVFNESTLQSSLTVADGVPALLGALSRSDGYSICTVVTARKLDLDGKQISGKAHK